MTRIALIAILCSLLSGALFVWFSQVNVFDCMQFLIWGLLSVFTLVIVGIWPVTIVLLLVLLWSAKKAPRDFKPSYLIAGTPIVFGVTMLLWAQRWSQRLPSGENWHSSVLTFAFGATIIVAVLVTLHLRKHLFFFAALLANFVWFAFGCGLIAWTRITGMGF